MTFKYIRGGEFLCWLINGHYWDMTQSRQMMGRAMNTCLLCGAYRAGPD